MDKYVDKIFTQIKNKETIETIDLNHALKEAQNKRDCLRVYCLEIPRIFLKLLVELWVASYIITHILQIIKKPEKDILEKIINHILDGGSLYEKILYTVLILGVYSIKKLK